MRRFSGLSNFQQDQRPIFIVKLLSGGRSFSKCEVDSLIAGCPTVPYDFFAFRVGVVAGRLFFRQWCDALEAVVYLWDLRLRGVHHLIPNVQSKFSVPSDRDDLSKRLKSVFAAHAKNLLDGEEARRCQKEIDALTDKIAKITGLLAQPTPLMAWVEHEGKKPVLEVERKQLNKRLDEFRAAMHCILAHLDGRKQDDCLELFSFVNGDLDWERMHYLMVRECRRLNEGLPIYAHRQEILQHIHHQQVTVLIGETGSGKSTQLVQYLADSGLAANGSIICTQPRKIAALSLAQRVREESNGCYAKNSVICYPTYSSVQGFNREVIFMTDHCLLQYFMYAMDFFSSVCLCEYIQER